MSDKPHKGYANRKPVTRFADIKWAPVVLETPHPIIPGQVDEIYSEYCEDDACPLLLFIRQEYGPQFPRHRGHTPFQPE